MAGNRKKTAGGKPNKKVRARKGSWNRQLLTKLDLPVETDATVPKLTMVGRRDLLLENHTGVLQYDASKIRLTTHEGVLEIGGNELELMELSAGRAYVRGTVTYITYVE